MSTDKSMILVGCLIMGDFNVSEGNSVFDVLKSNEMKFESLRDLKNADKSFTFNGFQNKFLLKIGSIIVNNQLTIDHMYFWAPPASPVKPLLFEVEKDNSDEFMSDHYPIIATFGANVWPVHRRRSHRYSFSMYNSVIYCDYLWIMFPLA